MKSYSLLFGALGLVAASFAPVGVGFAKEAGDQNGALVLEDSFERAELGDRWSVNTGSWEIVEGVLQAKEIPADEHSAAARLKVETTDAVYELRFRFIGEEGKAFHFGFDPAPGELDKKGHLFSVMITPASWKVMKHVDKAKPKEDPNETIAEAPRTFAVNQWYTLKVTTTGTEVTATIDGEDELYGSHASFGVKKPTLVFRCVGDGVEIDDVKVRSAAP